MKHIVKWLKAIKFKICNHKTQKPRTNLIRGFWYTLFGNTVWLRRHY
jgi:hypothetical protein